MQISIRDFRCFHNVSGIPIRPINLLVGENSTGKSSFLAATRFLLELFRPDVKPSFNKDPFFLGSYDQIAHYRGGRFGRAKEFSFSISDRIDKESIQRRIPNFRRPKDLVIPEHFEICVCLQNNRSQPTISRISFEAGRFGLEAKFGKSSSIELRTPSSSGNIPADRLVRPYDPFSYDLSYLEFVLRDARYLVGRDKVSKSFRDELPILSDLFRYVARSLPRAIYASAPVRSKPERTYNPAEATPTPGGEHIPFILAQIKAFDKELWTEIAETLSRFGQAAGLFDSVNVRQLSQAEGGPFQIVVNLHGSNSNIIDVGYGVSQILPIITELVRGRARTFFLFQQPEVHLHPKAQAELATFFAQVVESSRQTLFIETHSDYLIDRIRMEAREGRHIKPEDVSILYFDRSDLDVDIHVITIDETGSLRGVPRGYRNFFIREELRSIGADE